MEKLKILIPVDPELPVPPPLYGGVERLVDGLITEYNRKGHEVILLAHPDSSSRDAGKIYPWPAGSSRGMVNVIRNALTLKTVSKKEKPDVIHSFARLMYLYPTMFTTWIPFLMTYERFISPKSTALASILGGKRIHFTAAAGHMLNHLNRFKHKFTPVYNFTPVEFFTLDGSAKREHLMFLGRIEEIKGAKEAIEVALATNQKLVIAGNIQPGHDDYFNSFIRPHLDNPHIDYVGAVDDNQKRHYLQHSSALLFPIKWEEPFGIVMAEAMACGTPIIGFRRGSVPEVIRDGINGFAVETIGEMINAVSNLDQLDQRAIREDCEQRFSREVIAEQYLSLLNDLIVRNK